MLVPFERNLSNTSSSSTWCAAPCVPFLRPMLERVGGSHCARLCPGWVHAGYRHIRVGSKCGQKISICSCLRRPWAARAQAHQHHNTFFGYCTHGQILENVIYCKYLCIFY